MKWRGCLSNPARQNEAYRLELPGIGERPGSSWSSGYPEEGGPGYFVFFRDET